MKIFVILYIFLVVRKTFASRLLKNTHGLGIPFSPNLLLELPSDEWFQQKLDHFDPTNEKTWKQRYQVNSKYYVEGGPAFLMIGGESKMSSKWIEMGQWINYAKKYGAICFQVEHRYYGDSHPAEDTKVENLKYLSSEQALADLAYFISAINMKYNLTSLGISTKWIAFGGSYPGSLAAWLRIKYPFLVHGAVSSSGPLLAKVNFHEYFEIVSRSLSTYGEECVDKIYQAYKKMSEALTSKDGQTRFQSLFKTCSIIDVGNEGDISTLFENLAGYLAEVVQYNKDYRDSPTSNVTIDTICDFMTKSQKKCPMERYAELNAFMLKITNESCLDHSYAKQVANLKNTRWTEGDSDARMWTYQTCTEFGFYQTASLNSGLFPKNYFPVDYYIKLCSDVYGTEFGRDKFLASAVERTNILNGALGVDPSRIVFVHGSIDPWHALGITTLENHKHYQVVFIKGTAHCANMYPSGEKDSLELVKARKTIEKLIGKWLGYGRRKRYNLTKKK